MLEATQLEICFAQFQDLAKEVVAPSPAPIELHVHDVRFDNIHFQYPKSSKKLFEGLSFHIPHHAIFGIFGKSGTGKSSLLKLLLGFFTPSSGRILVGGHDVHKHHRRVIRRWFKLVCQRTFLFNATVLRWYSGDDKEFALPSRGPQGMHPSWREIQPAALLSFDEVQTLLVRPAAVGNRPLLLPYI